MKEDYKVELTNEISVERKDGHLYVTVEVETEDAVQELLDVVNEEIRFCEVCGKAINVGYTVDDGFFYCCEDCFEKYMNDTYGKGNYKPLDNIGINGGWWTALNSDGEWEDTGIYYTEWY